MALFPTKIFYNHHFYSQFKWQWYSFISIPENYTLTIPLLTLVTKIIFWWKFVRFRLYISSFAHQLPCWTIPYLTWCLWEIRVSNTTLNQKVSCVTFHARIASSLGLWVNLHCNICDNMKFHSLHISYHISLNAWIVLNLPNQLLKDSSSIGKTSCKIVWKITQITCHRFTILRIIFYLCMACNIKMPPNV